MSKTEVQQEKEWQGQDDARTLARAEEIKSDKKRLSNAIVQATKIAKTAEKEMKNIKKIANKSTPKKQTSKTPTKRR